MLDIVKNSPNGNGAVNGRGLRHRRLWPGERIALAADVATKQRLFEPSLGQVAHLFGVPIVQLRAELKARAAHQQHLEERDHTEAEQVNAIVTAWNNASFSAREVAVPMMGIDAIWQALTGYVPDPTDDLTA
jgi:hypothetical protein